MTALPWTPRLAPGAVTLGEVGEEAVLEAFTPLLHRADAEVGPGDDAAVLWPDAGRTVVTTDSMVLGLDWRDDWSGPLDVGRKIVAQNVADVVAMGARPTGIVVALAAESRTALDWVLDLTRGMAAELERAGTGVLGGDLSGMPDGVLITVTALGVVPPGLVPLRRDAARVGELLVVSEPVGRSHAGLLLLEQGLPGAETALTPVARACLAQHRAPAPRYVAGDEARRAGMRCAMDVSDGLVRDAGRIARASDVAIELDGAAVERMASPLTSVVGDRAVECVLAGGEEHALLGTCAPGQVPDGWSVLGRVEAGSGVRLDGRPVAAQGWSHFTG